MPQTLDGLLVVSLEQALAAPLASCRLADSGARVIKVERPGTGDFSRGYDELVGGDSTYFVWANRGKESVALDVKDPHDRGLLDRLLATADVFLYNLAPGAIERLGLGPEELQRRHPWLISCGISGYGLDGPQAGDKAYDLLVQAESGIASVTGLPEAPGRIGVSACDIAAGLSAHAAILEALLLRARTGTGSAIHVSLFAAMAEWMAVPLLHHIHSGEIWPRVGLSHPLIAPYGAYPTVDGLVLVGVQNDVEWQRLAAEVLGRPDMADSPDFATNLARVAHRPAVDELMRAHTGKYPVEDLLARFRDLGIACARINDVRGLAAHPQLRQMTVLARGAPVQVPVPPASWQGQVTGTPRVPLLDEDGPRIRAEFAAEPARNEAMH